MANNDPRTRPLKILIILTTLIVSFFIFNEFLRKSPKDNNLSSPVVSTELSPKSLKNIEREKGNEELKNVINAQLAGSSGKYGIVVLNFKTGEQYFRNDHETFDTASLYKLWVMAVVYQKIEKGELREDQILSEDVKTLNEKFGIGEEDAEQKEGTITYSVKNAVSKMITISDNYAALLLSSKIRLSSVSDFLLANNYFESKIGEVGGAPITSAADVGLFLKDLYDGKLAKGENTIKMIDLLKAQKLNNKFPKYLSKNAIVAHKTGELGTLTHDVGIVYSVKGDYVIVVLSDSNSPAGANERIANVSRAVYEYFETK